MNWLERDVQHWCSAPVSPYGEDFPPGPTPSDSNHSDSLAKSVALPLLDRCGNCLFHSNPRKRKTQSICENLITAHLDENDRSEAEQRALEQPITHTRPETDSSGLKSSKWHKPPTPHLPFRLLSLFLSQTRGHLSEDAQFTSQPILAEMAAESPK